MKMKTKPLKRLSVFFVALIMCLTSLAGLNLTAAASPSGDIGGQGGSMGDGAAGVNQWVQVQGVRLTALDAHTGNPIPGACSVDWVKGDTTPWGKCGRTADDLWTFGSVCKQEYRAGHTLDWQQGTYDYQIPPAGMPDVIVLGRSNINAIREFFIDEVIVKDFCANVYGKELESGFDSSTEAQALFDRFLSDELVLAIEPLVFMLWDGQLYGGTATEIALLAKETDAQRKEEGKKTLLYTNGELTHKGAPKALFLEEAHNELGYSTAGANHVGTTYLSNETIIKEAVGICIVWFTPPDPTIHHHIYNVKLNVPKGNTLSYNGKDIPLSTANITKILKGSPVKDDKGAEVSGGAELAKAMLTYCNAKGFITSSSTSGVGVWEDVISYELDNAFIFFVFKRSRRHVTA